MARSLTMLRLSPTMEGGVVSAWTRWRSATSSRRETGKATMEFRAFDAGTLLKKLVADEALVRCGQAVPSWANKAMTSRSSLTSIKPVKGRKSGGRPARQHRRSRTSRTVP